MLLPQFLGFLPIRIDVAWFLCNVQSLWHLLRLDLRLFLLVIVIILSIVRMVVIVICTVILIVFAMTNHYEMIYSGAFFVSCLGGSSFVSP